MNRAIKSRQPVRTRVTKICNDIEAEIATLVPFKATLIAYQQKLQKAKEQLIIEDGKVKDAMLDANKSDQEMEAEDEDVEVYHDRIREIMNMADYAVKPQTPAAKTEGDSTDKRYKLPKIELSKFDGDLKNWLGWWSQFEKIDKDTSLHAGDKFQYLIQATEEKSEPREIISAFPPTGDNYGPAIDSLKRRYGREGLQLQVYLRELLNLVIVNVTKKEKNPLDKLYLKLESHLRALNTLDLSKAEPSMYFYPLVESSLPDEVLRTWLRSSEVEIKARGPHKSKLENLMEFLKKEVEGEQQILLAKNTFQENKQKQGKGKSVRDDVPTAASLLNKSQGGGCIFCGKDNHLSQDCFKAAKMLLEEKKSKIQEARSCFICLKKGHNANKCKKPVRCSFCGRNHYPLLCPEGNKNKTKLSSGPEQVTVSADTIEVEPTVSSYNHSQNNRLILMKTLQVRVFGPGGQKVEVRLLFDEGSQRSYIKTSIAKQLNCKVVETLQLQNSLFGGLMTKIRSHNKYMVTVEGIGGRSRRDLCLVGEDVICTACPSVPSGPWIQKLAEKNIYLTDTCSKTPEIQLLIGSDQWGSLMTGNMVKLHGGLIAEESIFGWTLSGEVPIRDNSNYAGLTISMLLKEEKSLPDLWKLEVLGIRDSAEKISEEEHDYEVKKTLQEKITKDPDGRYVVNLPWISNPCELPTNRSVVEKRLISATDKLIRSGEYNAYDQIFHDWEKEGIIEEVQEDIATGHYLPHRPVFKPESLTTPVRPVFDASCKLGKNPSLNQYLEKGPNMLELIPSILLRFRQKKFGVISDIRKAFQMVGVSEEDRNFQKFVWWKDYDNRVMKTYRHCRVVFGLNCSPFILAAVLDFHLNQVAVEDRKTAEIIRRSLYVDNSVVSFDSECEFLKFKEDSIRILALAKMVLRQWESSIDNSSNQITSVLGMRWDKLEDTLSCDLPKDLKQVSQITKRSVLSLVSRIYDPIGFTCPAVLQPKMMLQDSWTTDLSWDAEWDEDRKEVFLNWCNQLDALDQIKIPRWIRQTGQEKEIQLHTFCDASQDAYAVVVYLRIENGEKVTVQLVQAKSRLAPLDKNKNKKKVTINRLELLACLIGSRITATVKESLSLDGIPIYMWSDSTNALAWIRRDEDWGNFVGNRVREISRLTKAEDWRHVPGNMNPADLPSRGCAPLQLLKSNWWEGPSWLKESEESWPTFQGEVNEELISKERKKTVCTAVAEIQCHSPRFSCYFKNVCVAAWVRRFVGNCRKVKETRVFKKFPTSNEICQGERDLVFDIQRRHYPKKPEIKGMDTLIKDDKLIHVKTRLLYKDDTDLYRSPILLPKEDPLVHQLIRFIHRSNCHAGTQFVLGKLRDKYWILSGRKTVGKVINKCVTCKRHSSKSQSCEPAPLPQGRVETQSAFQTTGVDLAGPIILKSGKKCWIVLYTCAVYRGVYLDIVDTLTTEDFLDSLEKFTCIIGRPNHIYSDNGTNFVGAQNLMKRLKWNKLETQLHVKQIKWSFNPPSSPWWGGWWERLVRSMKELLRRMLGTAKLSKKELEKCLAAVSYTINNRPLTTLTEDGEDLIPLTPNMFMKDLPVFGLPERDSITGHDLRKSHGKLLNLKKALRERFRKEYLANLVQNKSEMKCGSLKVGDVVLVGADNRKRYEWPLGKILELIPGKDGKFRVAKVKTMNGILTRPLQRLYFLEVSSPQSVPVPVNTRAKTEMKDRPDVTNPEEDLRKTKSGRVVKKPTRYSSWCY